MIWYLKLNELNLVLCDDQTEEVNVLGMVNSMTNSYALSPMNTTYIFTSRLLNFSVLVKTTN